MIVKSKITDEDIRQFFQFEAITLEKSMGKTVYNIKDKTVIFDELSLFILGLSHLNSNTRYGIHHNEVPSTFRKSIEQIQVEPFDVKTEFTYSDVFEEEILCKVDKQDNQLIIHIISMAIILKTEKQLMQLNKVLKASNDVFTVATWWTDYDKYSDHFYQTPSGVRLLGEQENKDRLYSVVEFQKVRERAARQNPFFEECINAESEAYERVRSNETDYFAGRTPASNSKNEEVWIEAYGKCLLRYPDGSPRFFVAIDIYLSDLFEKSNQISLLNSLLNQGLQNSNVGIWYYVRQYDKGIYEFTESHRDLMKYSYELTNENVTEMLDKHFEQIAAHTPEYEQYLIEWRQAHNNLFYKGENSYKKIIPNSLDKNNPQWIQIRGTVLERDENGRVKLFVGVNVDITETVSRNHELERLRKENERLQLAEKLAIKAGNVLVWYQDFTNEEHSRYIYGNEMFTNRLAIDRSEDGLFRISALHSTMVKSDPESKALAREFIEKLNKLYTNQIDHIQDVLVKHKNKKTGEIIYFENNIEIEERFEDGSVKLVGGFMKDVTENVERQKKIAFLANNDILTGLRNRNYFDTFISSGALPKSYSVLLFDLDGLKLINDAFGHYEGDRAIKQVAKFLTMVFKESLVIARIGGDEFIVITRETDAVLITDMANIFEDKIFDYNQEAHIELNVSKGGYVVEDNEVEFERAFTHAENLMYRRKLNNRSSRKSKALSSILETLNAKTEETIEHSDRIEEYSTKICQALGIGRSSDLEDIRLLAKVHDIGKITIPDNILNKPGRLTEEEFEVVKKHPEAGYKIIKNITDSDFVCEAVLSHHEKFDGTGYPQGLKGKQIPLFARIISVADAFDAMTTDRVYHKGISTEEAIEELVRCSGTHFDPEIVQAFLKSHFDIDKK